MLALPLVAYVAMVTLVLELEAKTSLLFHKVLTSTGRVLRRDTVESQIQCAVRCAVDTQCNTITFSTGDTENVCEVIRKVCTGTVHFESNDSTTLYESEHPEVHFDFEDLSVITGMVNYNGSQFIRGATPFSPATTVLSVNRSLSQWVDLGRLCEACMTVPETCGEAGGTLSLWMKLHDPTNYDQYISSTERLNTGFVIQFHGSKLSYNVMESHGFYSVNTRDPPTGWFHALLLYHGAGRGITLYHDGNHVQTDTDRHAKDYGTGSGHVVVGYRVYGVTPEYGSVSLDELRMYNRQLSLKEIQTMY